MNEKNQGIASRVCNSMHVVEGTSLDSVVIVCVASSYRMIELFLLKDIFLDMCRIPLFKNSYVPTHVTTRVGSVFWGHDRCQLKGRSCVEVKPKS